MGFWMRGAGIPGSLNSARKWPKALELLEELLSKLSPWLRLRLIKPYVKVVDKELVSVVQYQLRE